MRNWSWLALFAMALMVVSGLFIACSSGDDDDDSASTDDDAATDDDVTADDDTGGDDDTASCTDADVCAFIVNDCADSFGFADTDECMSLYYQGCETYQAEFAACVCDCINVGNVCDDAFTSCESSCWDVWCSDY